jgi:hypothetical protein
MKESMVHKVMSEMGRKGGKIGGKRSLETMTPEERTARAKKAAAASAKVRAKRALLKDRAKGGGE